MAPTVDQPVDWQTCSSPDCIGVAIPDRGGKCLAHLDEADLSAALQLMTQEKSLDVRGVRLNAKLIHAITNALLSWDGDNRPRLKTAEAMPRSRKPVFSPRRSSVQM